EDEIVAGEPRIPEVGHERVVRLVVPELLRLAGADVGLPHADRVAALEGRARETWNRGDLRRSRLIAGRRLPAALTSTTAAVAAAPAGRRSVSVERWTVRQPERAAAALRLLPERQSRPPHEDDALAVIGPLRVVVEVHARGHVLHGPHRHVVDHDEAV